MEMQRWDDFVVLGKYNKMDYCLAQAYCLAGLYGLLPFDKRRYNSGRCATGHLRMTQPLMCQAISKPKIHWRPAHAQCLAPTIKSNDTLGLTASFILSVGHQRGNGGCPPMWRGRACTRLPASEGGGAPQKCPEPTAAPGAAWEQSIALVIRDEMGMEIGATKFLVFFCIKKNHPKKKKRPTGHFWPTPPPKKKQPQK